MCKLGLEGQSSCFRSGPVKQAVWFLIHNGQALSDVDETTLSDRISL
jgi:hydrogenase maturation factor